MGELEGIKIRYRFYTYFYQITARKSREQQYYTTDDSICKKKAMEKYQNEI